MLGLVLGFWLGVFLFVCGDCGASGIDIWSHILMPSACTTIDKNRLEWKALDFMVRLLIPFVSFRFGLWRFCPPTFVCSANRKRNQEVEAGRWKVYQPPKTHISLKGFLGPCTYSIYLIELRYLCAKWISRWIAAHVLLKLWPDPIM